MSYIQELHERASREGWALGHFNVSSAEQIRSVVQAALNVKCPVLVGASEGERKYLGLRQAVALVRSFREETGLPIFLNADHSKSVEAAKAATDAGYDSIHIDLSHLSYEENVKGTKEVVQYVRVRNLEAHVEAEIGLLKGESKIQREVIEVRPEDMTTSAQAADFVKKTGINRLAPAVGNIHGLAENEKIIYPDLIRKIRGMIPQHVGITLHGGSGISDALITAAIKEGVNNIHINTEIRVAAADAIRSSLAEHPEETTPYKLLEPMIRAVQLKVEEKLKLFGAVNKI